MKIHLTALVSCAAAALPAQNYLTLPATAQPAMELNSYSLIPLMQPNARVQSFYDAAEVGSTSFTATELSLRYDGPIPQVGHPGPFAITRLRISVGTTSVAQPDGRFAENLSQPLTLVFDGPWTFSPDPGSAAPHGWGDPADSLTFPFQTPANVTIGSGEWLVVDVLMEGNNIANFGFAHAMLDGASTSGGVTDGSAVAYGQGCPATAGGAAPVATSAGQRAPGGVHYLRGTNLGANAIVFPFFGLSDTASSFGPLPYTLPGTSCQLLASIDLTGLAFANNVGAITNYQAGAALAIPPDTSFAGMVLYEQLAAYAPGANPWDAVLSNGLAVTLGSFAAPGRGTYTAWNAESATSPFATEVKAFGYAMRLRTL